MAKNRKTKTFSSKYGQYTSPIELTEDGITYEVLLENIIAYMNRHFDEEPYKSRVQMLLEPGKHDREKHCIIV